MEEGYLKDLVAKFQANLSMNQQFYESELTNGRNHQTNWSDLCLITDLLQMVIKESKKSEAANLYATKNLWPGCIGDFQGRNKHRFSNFSFLHERIKQFQQLFTEISFSI